MSIEIAFPIEHVTAITPSLCHTVVLLACVSVAVIGIGKRLFAEAAHDGNIMLRLAMVHQSVLAHKRKLFLRAEIAGEAFAMSALDVLLQVLLGLAANIALLALVGKASLTVDVLFRLARKFFAASFARRRDSLWSSLMFRHGAEFI